MNNLNKKIYIRDNINKVEKKLIINFIYENNIIHTKNKNGFFFDLNSISDDKIIILYNLILNYINNVNIINKEKEIDNNYNNYMNKNKIINKDNKIIINNHINICEFDKKYHKIINLSKKY